MIEVLLYVQNESTKALVGVLSLLLRIRTSVQYRYLAITICAATVTDA
jgi:hypothetical protein